MFSSCAPCLVREFSSDKMADVVWKWINAGTRPEHNTLRQPSVELEFGPMHPGALGTGLTQCCRRHTRTWRASTWRDARREYYSEVGGKGERRPNMSSQNPHPAATTQLESTVWIAAPPSNKKHKAGVLELRSIQTFFCCPGSQFCVRHSPVIRLMSNDLMK